MDEKCDAAPRWLIRLTLVRVPSSEIVALLYNAIVRAEWLSVTQRCKID
jgi:hypothetical protein